MSIRDVVLSVRMVGVILFALPGCFAIATAPLQTTGEAYRQPDMFIAPPEPKPEQMDMLNG